MAVAMVILMGVALAPGSQAAGSRSVVNPAVGGRSVVSQVAGSRVVGSPAVGSQPAGGSGCSSVPFRRHESGYSYFRIPAVVATTGTTLLAFAEGRTQGGSDSGNIDLVVRRSRDGGCTWGRIVLVADDGSDTIGNPAPVYDSVTRKVLLLATGNGGQMTGRGIAAGRATGASTRRVYQFTSADEGKSWSRKEITRSVKKTGWRWYATGPGHGLQINGGPHRGRLVVTGVHSIGPSGSDLGTEHKYSGTHAIVSDDHGRTWRIGFVDSTYDGRVNTNETAVAQLPGGLLYFNSRDQFGSAPGNRAFSYSGTGGNTLNRRFVAAPGIAAPMVQCSVLGLGSGLYFAGPSSLDGTRSRLTIRGTTDNGAAGRFGSQYMVWNGYAAYSDLVATSATAIGVLYERGRTSPYDEIAFQTIDTANLTPL